MDPSKDYYSILGVLPSAEPEVIKAVYRVLQKKFHPDVYRGDGNSESISRFINEAFEVLSTPSMRARYDSLRRAKSGSFSFQDSGNNSENLLDEEQRLAWTYVCRYYPEAEKCSRKLFAVAATLGLAYKLAIIERKAGAEALEIYETMLEEYAERYFGRNSEVQRFALEVLQEGRRDVALEINKAINILGSPEGADAKEFISRVKNSTGYQSRVDQNSERHAAAARVYAWKQLNKSRESVYGLQWIAVGVVLIIILMAFRR